MTNATTLITPADRIFVAGHRDMAGSAICRALQHAGYNVCKANISYT
jgi:GDP-L-fucose synthase